MSIQFAKDTNGHLVDIAQQYQLPVFRVEFIKFHTQSAVQDRVRFAAWNILRQRFVARSAKFISAEVAGDGI